MLFYPLLGAQLLNELSKFGTGGGNKLKKLVFIIPCQDSIQGFDDGSNQKFYRG